uniref:Peptidase M12A domain-containing protein n=1 Tax=Anopheles minimus TaxID=112268 RepID=A0A182W1Z5_9DIPT
MVLCEEQVRSTWSNKHNMLALPIQRFPGGIATVSIYEQHLPLYKSSKMKKLPHTCVKFVKLTIERNFVNFTGTKSGCYSSSGYHGGQQTLNVQSGPDCRSDEYADNIDPNRESNFHKFLDNIVKDFGMR